MNFNQYLPQYLSELEYDYKELINLIKLEKTFIINGKSGCGKTTILKLYLEYLNYDFNIIKSDIKYEEFISLYKFKSKSLFSFIYNKKYVIIIKDFEEFNDKIKEYILNDKNKFYILITTRYLNKNINFVYIYPPSFNYLSSIYLNIYFIETNNYNIDIPHIKNFFDIKNFLYININNYKNNLLVFQRDEFIKKDINKIIKIKNFNEKLNEISKIESNNLINYNLIYNYNNLDDLITSYDYLLESFNFYNFYNINYYDIFNSLNIIGPLNNLNNNVFKIEKTNLHIKKKKNLNYIN
jgi:hypothetical protein